MTIIHLSNSTNFRNGGGIYEVASNFVTNMRSNSYISRCYFVRWYNFPFHLLFKNKSDLIIHRHGLWTLESILLFLIFKIFRIPFYLNPHGLYGPKNSDKSSKKKLIFFNLFENYLFDNACCVLACSESEKQLFINEKIKTKKIAVLRNGIGKSFFTPRNMEKKVKNSICYFGQIIPIKNIEDPINALFSIRKDLTLKIAGYGDEKYENRLKDLVKELKLNDQVSFIGPLYEEERIDLYDECEIFILPSYNENFGIVVLEALSRGCKVITTTGTPWKDINLKNLYIYEPNDLVSLKKIIEMIVTVDHIEDNSEELEQYKWPSIVNELINIYQIN